MTDFNAIVSSFAAAQRAVATPAETWSAWRLGERESDAIPLIGPDTLDDVVRQAMHKLALQPGDTLAVQLSHSGLRKFTLWQFTVKRSTKRWTYRSSLNGGPPVRVAALEAKLLSQVAMAAPFEPVLRFDAFRDDAVGVDRSLVEAR